MIERKFLSKKRGLDAVQVAWDDGESLDGTPYGYGHFALSVNGEAVRLGLEVTSVKDCASALNKIDTMLGVLLKLQDSLDELYVKLKDKQAEKEFDK